MGRQPSKIPKKFGSMNTNGIKKSLVYLADNITRSLKISSSINWTAITGSGKYQRNALGASAIIFHY
jgi:hypothetical protein